MNSKQLQQLVKLIHNAKSNEEKTRVIKKNPELLTEEVTAHLRDLARRYQAKGKYKVAQTFTSVLVELSRSTEKTPDLSKMPATKWAHLARQSLGQRNNELMVDAINVANQSGSSRMVEFLKSSQSKDLEIFMRLAPEIYRQLRLEGHDEEAWTTVLIYLSHLASLATTFRSAPHGEQSQLLKIGTNACKDAIGIARTLQANSCIAHFQFLLAQSYQSVHRLSEAEVLYRDALATYQRLAQTEPQIYESIVARIQNNFGAMLIDVGRLPEAEIVCRAAVQTYRGLAQTEPHVYENDLATTQNNLGALLIDLQRPREAEFVFNQALKIYQRLAQTEPQSYESHIAMTKNNLGALLNRSWRLSEAEVAYRDALDIYQRLAQREPQIYMSKVASVQNNIGALLNSLMRLSEAEIFYRDALETYRQLIRANSQVYEGDMAMMHNNLGALLNDLGRLSESENSYRAAQEIYNRCDVPADKAKLLGNFGLLLTDQPDRRTEGIKILQEAMETVETLRAEVLSIERQQQIVSENFRIYENLLIALMREERFDEALELAEKSRNRTLTDLMVSRDLEPRNVPPALLDEYRETLARARALNDRRPDEMDARGSNGAAPNGNSEGTWGETRGGFNRLEETYRQLDDLTSQLLKFDPEFLPRATSLKTDEIRQLARDCGQTLVLFRITEDGSSVFLVFPDGETDVVSIPDFSADDLQELMVNAPAAGQTESGGGWVTDYYNARQNTAATSQWKATLERTLGELHARLMRPVRDKLRDFNDLVLVPNRALAILPLHACWWDDHDGRRHYWLDEFTIRYTPSLTIYGRCRKNEIGRGRQSLLGIANPTQDLDFAQWECREIEAIRGDANCLMLWNKQATRSGLEGALAGQHLLHFSCHGRYDLGAPLNSAIALAGPSELSLADIFQHIQLPHSWLVVLSACETGLSDFRQIADEQFGLSTGFLYAGAPTVYSSLWAVDDGSTALLMILVYELLQSEPDLDKATLLIRAQRQLRDMTTPEIEQLLATRDDSDGKRFLQSKMAEFFPNERPYEHPVAWAAFQCVGV